ncbi:ArsC family reductase [Vibrio hippocampi]|uniref:Protein YffB n=1 Tax=Vibrio hippocampi TaxID=654686 RepID=A0ABN8DE08_9VIBR|nr:ArsC family reductase [Vibrio hippocampi]CAH0525005.1 Protein YffB [Vibrio hippocampi]
MAVTMFGIPNCDTIKKAKKWLEANNIEFSFHDYRKQGIDAEMVSHFCKQLGWENVLNKRGTTFRQLTPEQKETLSLETALPLLVDNSAMIKRPILDIDGSLHLGFKADQYQQIFSNPS